jgi:hypothetical protein
MTFPTFAAFRYDKTDTMGKSRAAWLKSCMLIPAWSVFPYNDALQDNCTGTNTDVAANEVSCSPEFPPADS